MTERLYSKPATEVVDLLRAGDIAPREVLDDIAARVEAVNPAVNALVTLCFDRAHRHAAALAAKPSAVRGVLAGLPVPIKDAYAVEGVRTTMGSLAFADHVPSHSDYLVEAIEAAGGVVFAKSNTPEFEAGANTFNEVFGRTLNPWDISRSAAGSSGGAAAAVATGMAHIAQGSDNACSVRYPAAFCGVVGLRPSPGLIPNGPSPLPHQVLSVIGPIARRVADVGLGLDAMVRFDPRDPRTRPMPGQAYRAAAEAPEKPARAAFSIDLGGIARVSQDVRAVVQAAVARLEAAGLDVAEATPDARRSREAFLPIRAFQFAALHGAALERHRDKLKPEVVWNIEEGLKLTTAELALAERARGEARAAMVGFVGRHGVLITPTAPVAPYPVEKRYVDEIDGEKLGTYIDWLVLGYAITVTGCPAISIPCGFTGNGLPVGLQLVGSPYGEAELLRTAAWCETVLGASLTAPIDPRIAA
ncbi:MAG TPA: amidase family protein [Bauldia sp.]|nr:amidase family protein [Bauldia sp.]